jgi:hypothetical protein
MPVFSRSLMLPSRSLLPRQWVSFDTGHTCAYFSYVTKVWNCSVTHLANGAQISREQVLWVCVCVCVCVWCMRVRARHMHTHTHTKQACILAHTHTHKTYAHAHTHKTGVHTGARTVKRPSVCASGLRRRYEWYASVK